MRVRLAGAVLFLVLAACGGSKSGHTHDANPARRTETIEMRDIEFVPAEMSVLRGQTVHFVFHNVGQSKHDAFLGDAKAQESHESEMRGGGMAGMEHGGSKGQSITVAPGQTGNFSFHFDKAGTFFIGCHEPGHYAAGMKLTVRVT